MTSFRLILAVALLALLAACAGSGSAGLPLSIALPDSYYPEGLTAKADGTLFVGSLTESDIRIVRPGQTNSEVFISAGRDGLASVLGLLADEPSATLYACSNSAFGVSKFNKTEAATLFAFDITTGALKRKYPLPTPALGISLCSDILVDSAGQVFVTDSFQPRLLTLDKTSQALNEWANDPASGGLLTGVPNFNGIAAVGLTAIYAGNYGAGKLFRMNRGTSGQFISSTQVALDRPLVQPDGIRAIDSQRLLVVEQVQTQGDGNQGKVSIVNVATGKIQEIATGLTSPTSTVVIGGRAYFVEGQLGQLLGLIPGATVKPFKISSVPVPNLEQSALERHWHARLALPVWLCLKNPHLENRV